jgi:hypothetical protein
VLAAARTSQRSAIARTVPVSHVFVQICTQAAPLSHSTRPPLSSLAGPLAGSKLPPQMSKVAVVFAPQHQHSGRLPSSPVAEILHLELHSRRLMYSQQRYNWKYNQQVRQVGLRSSATRLSESRHALVLPAAPTLQSCPCIAPVRKQPPKRSSLNLCAGNEVLQEMWTPTKPQGPVASLFCCASSNHSFSLIVIVQTTHITGTSGILPACQPGGSFGTAAPGPPPLRSRRRRHRQPAAAAATRRAWPAAPPRLPPGLRTEQAPAGEQIWEIFGGIKGAGTD